MVKASLKYRLSLDLGTNSLGWCALSLDDQKHSRRYRILSIGSRIFSDGRDPKSGASLAIDRRVARSMRRRRDRFKQRQEALLKHLNADGLFPGDEQERKALERLDPYELRARALDEALPPYHLGRMFFQLNQRRGFKSNRKTDRSDDDEAGKIAVGVNRLREAIEEKGARTFGEFLHFRRQVTPDPKSTAPHIAVPSVRARLRPETGEGAKGDGYDFYPGRDLVEEEFNEIWNRQVQYHPTLLTAEARKQVHEIIFGQRPLKAPKIGKCTLVPTEERIAKAHPLFQRRRLLEEVNALDIVVPGSAKQKLTKEQRDLLLMKLRDKQKVSFESLRKTLKLDPDARFNKESENRKDLAGDEIYAQFSDKKRFGNRWGFFSVDEQWAIIERLRDEEDDAKLKLWLKETYDLTDDQVKAIASAHLPQGFGRFGLTATRDLIEELQADVIVYSDAVKRADFPHHSDFRNDKISSGEPIFLPYYGVALERYIMPGTAEPTDPEEMRVGRITNPTVHIGLNQLRQLVNTLIRAYGPPAEIALELARDLKQTEEQKQEENRRNTANRRDAERRSEKLREIGKQDSGSNRALLKLWEELNLGNVLDRRCVYTGQQVSIDMLFNGTTEVDHILPFSETLDDSNGNKILCMREANRIKRKRTPYEAFGHTPKMGRDLGSRGAPTEGKTLALRARCYETVSRK